MSDVAEAWRLLISVASGEPDPSPGLLHDLVDVTRNMLQDMFAHNYGALVQAYHDKDLRALM